MKKLLYIFLSVYLALPAFAQERADAAFDAAETFVNRVQAKKKQASFTPGRPYTQKRINALAKLDKEQLFEILRAERADYYNYLVQNIQKYGYFDLENLQNSDAATTPDFDPEDFAGINLSLIYDFIKRARKTPVGAGFDYAAVMPADAKVFLFGEVHLQGAERPVALVMNSVNKRFGARAAALEHVVEGSEDYAEILAAKNEAQIARRYNKNVRKGRIVDAVVSVPDFTRLFRQIKGLDIIGLDNIRFTLSGLDVGRGVKIPRGLLQSILILAREMTASGTYVPYAGRNTLWINKLLPFLEAGEAVMVYGGAAHTSYTSKDYSVADYFAKTGYKPVSIFFINAWNFSSDDIRFLDFTKTKEYLIKVPKEKRALLGADYFIIYRGPVAGVPDCLQEGNICTPAESDGR